MAERSPSLARSLMLLDWVEGTLVSSVSGIDNLAGVELGEEEDTLKFTSSCHAENK